MAARVEPWIAAEKEVARARPAEFVVGNEHGDKFEEPEELRKVTVGRAQRETATRARSTNIDGGTIKLTRNRNGQEYVFSDFYFMSTIDGSTSFARFIEKTGVKRFINFSDNEPSILARKDAVTRSLPFVESIPEWCLVGDYQSNGSIEVSVRELKRQLRAVRMQLEKRLGIELANDDPILAWIPTFSET